MGEMNRRHASPMERQMTSAADRSELPDMDATNLEHKGIVAAKDAEIESLRTAKSHLKQQAQIHAREATTQRSIVIGILRSLGLPENDWEAERLVATHVAEVRNANLEMIAVLRGVLRVADRQTDEFDAARDVLAKATGE